MESKEEWKSFRKNFLNNGLQEISSSKESKPFSFQTNGLIWGSPVVDEEGTVYIGSVDKYFYAISSSGNLVWKFKTKDTPDSLIDSAALITKSEKIIVPGGDGYLYALDKKTGKEIWSFKAYHATEEQVASRSLVNSFEGNVVQGPNGCLYAGSDNGHLYCLDEDGHELWNFKTGMVIWSAPVFSPDNKWMSFGSLDSHLYLLEPESGRRLDKIKAGELKASPTYDSENNILFIGNSAGEMQAFKIAENKLQKLWKFKTKKEIYSSASYFMKKVYFGSMDGNLYCLDYSGNLVWKYSTFSTIASSPAVIKDKAVVFGAGNGKIYALDFKGTKIWSYNTSDFLHGVNLDSSPAISSSGMIYIGSYNGMVYGIPFNCCLENKEKKCGYGLTEEIPFEPGKVLRFEDREGNTKDQLKVGLSEPIKIRLIVFKDGRYVSNAAVKSFGLDVSIYPKVKFLYRVSGDGHFIDLVPQDFWELGTDYTIKIKGKHYLKTNFFTDKGKWLFLPKFDETLKFSTKEAGNLEKMAKAYKIEKISLFHPLSVNTLAAAAIAGQRFLVKIDKSTGNEFSMQLTPAFEKNETFYAIATERQITLKGKFKGKYFVAKGSPTLSVMGAIVPLGRAVVSGEFDKGRILNGMIFSEISPFKMKGNLKNYKFPLSLINETCNSKLKIIVAAKFEGK